MNLYLVNKFRSGVEYVISRGWRLKIECEFLVNELSLMRMIQSVNIGC